VGPLLLVLLGVVALGVGWLAMRSLGPRVRVGRILASTPVVSVAEAKAAATAGHHRYVGVKGRIDSEQDFEDAAHRPLVLRRTRFEARQGRGWRVFEDQKELVPFEVHEGLDAIAVDGDALTEGLVVVPRESVGVAGDLGDRAPADLPASTPVRVIVEQLSAVDHALVLGVPAVGGAGTLTLTEGLGRPLVLTNLEQPEAIRLLGGGRRALGILAGVLLALGAVAIGVGALWAVIEALT
jgi:hypothetical protein